MISIVLLAIGILVYLLSHDSIGSTKSPKHQTEVTNMRWTKKNRYGNTFVYTGTVIDSIPNGHGKARYSDGSYYEGLFHDAMRDDKNAKYIDPKGNTFTGAYSKDTIQNGRITASDGRYYEGSFSDDKPFNGEWHDADGKVMYQVVDGKLINVQ